MRGGSLDECRAHVDADLGGGGWIAAMFGQIVGKGGDRGGILGVGHEQHLRAIQIDEQRDIVVAAACGGLVEGHPADAAVIGTGAGRIDRVVDDPPQPGIVLANHAGGGGNRHGGDQVHDMGLKQQRKAAAVARPRHAHRLDAASLASDARPTRIQIGLVLPEVQMPPRQRPCVVDRAVRRATGRAGEPRVLVERDVDVQPLRRRIEARPGDKPRFLQPQRRLKRLKIPHIRRPAKFNRRHARLDAAVKPVPTPEYNLELWDLHLKQRGAIFWKRTMSLSETFEHAGGSQPRSPELPIYLYASTLAQAENLGLHQMAHISHLSYEKLAWFTKWYIREETLKKTFTKIVNRQYH